MRLGQRVTMVQLDCRVSRGPRERKVLQDQLVPRELLRVVQVSLDLQVHRARRVLLEQQDQLVVVLEQLGLKGRKVLRVLRALQAEEPAQLVRKVLKGSKAHLA